MDDLPAPVADVSRLDLALLAALVVAWLLVAVVASSPTWSSAWVRLL